MHTMAGLGRRADLVPWGAQLGEGGDEVWGAWGQDGGGSDDSGGCRGAWGWGVVLSVEAASRGGTGRLH